MGTGCIAGGGGGGVTGNWCICIPPCMTGPGDITGGWIGKVGDPKGAEKELSNE